MYQTYGTFNVLLDFYKKENDLKCCQNIVVTFSDKLLIILYLTRHIISYNVISLFICTHIWYPHYRTYNMVIRAGTRKKGPFGFPVCGSSNAHAQSPVWATGMCVLLEASSRSLLYVCEQQRLWRDLMAISFEDIDYFHIWNYNCVAFLIYDNWNMYA